MVKKTLSVDCTFATIPRTTLEIDKKESRSGARFI
jgi:hypothetical protein